MKGIFVPLMTPFINDELKIDLIPDMVNHHISQGVHGFYVGGSSAECFMMSVEERCQVLKAISTANAGRVKIIAHVGAISLREALQLTNAANAHAYDAISATPPFYYGFNTQEIEVYYQSIAKASDVPLLLYNIPGTTGINLTLEDMKALSTIPNVIGLKHTTQDMFIIERLHAHNPDLLIFHGEDTMLLNGLQMGASGGIGSTYNLMSKQYVELFQAYENGDIDAAMAIQHTVNAVTEVLLTCGLYQSIKFAMNEQGVNYGECRRPFSPLSDDKKAQLLAVLKQLK